MNNIINSVYFSINIYRYYQEISQGIKKARRLAILSLRISSPLRCLTSVFGMGTGVSTAPSPPDFFLREIVLSKLDIITFVLFC